MSRNGSKILPSLELTRYGLGDGWLTVTEEALTITVFPADGRPDIPLDHMGPCTDPETIMVLDPGTAPLFRMIAKRLDALAERGKR